jgi:lysophospholipase L1-like esterase
MIRRVLADSVSAKLLLVGTICWMLLACPAQEIPATAVWPTGATLDYVTLGDSITRESRFPEMYAAHIEEDLGVEVKLHNEAIPGESTAATLRRVRDPDELRNLVAEADVITINVSASAMRFPEGRFLTGDCGGHDNQVCLRKSVETVQNDWASLLDEVLELRNSKRTIVRVLTLGTWVHSAFYAEHLAFREKAGPEEMDIMLKYFLEMNDSAAETASQRSIPVVDLGREFQGHGFQDNVPQEYLWLDGIHLSEQGSAVVANLLSDLGYEPLPP